MKETQKKAELRGLSKISEGKADNLFFIRIFNVNLPIPNRFTLVASETDRHEFNSMTNYGTTKDLIGFIVIGSLVKDEQFINKFVPNEKFITQKLEHNNLTVRKYTVNTKYGDLVTIFIHNNNEYLIVSDANTLFWMENINEYLGIRFDK
jgi:hypothetical protein